MVLDTLYTITLTPVRMTGGLRGLVRVLRGYGIVRTTSTTVPVRAVLSARGRRLRRDPRPWRRSASAHLHVHVHLHHLRFSMHPHFPFRGPSFPSPPAGLSLVCSFSIHSIALVPTCLRLCLALPLLLNAQSVPAQCERERWRWGAVLRMQQAT